VAVKGSVYRKAALSEIARAHGSGYVLHAHGGEFDDWYPTQPSASRRWVRRLFRGARIVIALSESWGRFYANEFGLEACRIEVLPNPVRIPPSPPARRGRALVRFLFLGSMDERKGAFRAVRAFASLPDELKVRSRLTLAGNGRVGDMRSLVSELGVKDRVEVRDWVGPAGRDALLVDSDVYVLPSLNEGLPMGMLEAMSWQLPVLTTPVGGIPELVVDGVNGLLVPPTDLASLTAAMARLARDEALRESLGRAGRESVRPLGIEGYVERLSAILHRAVELGR
jgi:glycosyltransferase involved in cell wall biosynthesis